MFSIQQRPFPLDLKVFAVLLLITGPNMAGKSTYIRQAAILVLMAQVGSFIPAAKARIGIVDRIFTRAGLSDDISGGQSTFMVEMVETAAILNQATDRSLAVVFSRRRYPVSTSAVNADHQSVRWPSALATYANWFGRLRIVRKHRLPWLRVWRSTFLCAISFG